MAAIFLSIPMQQARKAVIRKGLIPEHRIGIAEFLENGLKIKLSANFCAENGFVFLQKLSQFFKIDKEIHDVQRVAETRAFDKAIILEREIFGKLLPSVPILQSMVLGIF